jgi:hypothetical protein
VNTVEDIVNVAADTGIGIDVEFLNRRRNWAPLLLVTSVLEIFNGVLGVSRDTFLNLIEHMRYRQKTMLKNV